MVARKSSGIRVTQIGVDARYAADYQYVFNSDWPSLAIAFDDLVAVEIGQTITVPHGLKFYPFTEGWLTQDGKSIGRIYRQSGSLSGAQTDIQLTFDKTNVYLTNNGSVDYEVYVRCYNLDISQSVDYTLPETPTIKRVYDPTHGIKVAKFGKNINSNDLRDFILHSRAQSPAVLSVVTQDDAYTGRPFNTFYVYNLIYKNPVNYVPWAYAFYGTKDGTYEPIAPGLQQTPPGFILTNQIADYITQVQVPPGFTGAGSVFNYIDIDAPQNSNIAATIVMLRDPLIVPNTIEVVY